MSSIEDKWIQDTLVQSDAENGPIQSDLLSDIDDNEPTVRSERFTMEELQQLDKMHEDECELAFESVNNLFPALERNGTEIRNNLDWDFNDQITPCPLHVANNTTTQ